MSLDCKEANPIGENELCASFADETSSASVTVRFHNNTGADLYLPGNCDALEYTITPRSGDDGVTYAYDTSAIHSTCFATCEDLQTQPQVECGACYPVSFRLPAGGTREVTWNGTGMSRPQTMPSECWLNPQGQQQCERVVTAAAGSYAIDVAGYTSCGPSCTCDPSGKCSNAASGDKAMADPVSFGFPGANAVDVTFGACAFGCP